jgi:NAD+ synthase (glutamine-hydrolysing)
MTTLRVALAQINLIVGDLDGNVEKIIDYIGRARDLGVDVVSFPELAVTGYPPEDLLLRPAFIDANLRALDAIVQSASGITAVVGFADRDEHGVYNAAAVIHGGKLASVYHKQRLPNYGVFDELRYFRAGAALPVCKIAGTDVGVNVCEDIWYPGDPTESQAAGGAGVIININGSPFHVGKRRDRQQMLAERARAYGVFICYTNLIGGQDELVFDGGSMVLDPNGELIARAAAFEEELLVCDLKIDDREPTASDRVTRVPISDVAPIVDKPPVEPRIAPELSVDAEVYSALVLGTRDYLRKTGFGKALIALSGGIDSSLVAAVAVDALGAANVVGVGMPSRYSSEGSVADAKALAENLGIELIIVPIEPAHAAYIDMLETPFGELGGSRESGVAEENIQSRIRGNVIMAMSNKLGWIVLTTGNKSEFATGYATLYGDMSGGFAVIKDVPKTMVYDLCRYRNSLDDAPVIPESVLTKPPSAELKPDQLDQDTLPPYDVLDAILKAYVEGDKSVPEIVELGYERETVLNIVRMVDRNEYKRRQAPPGVKITPRSFDRDWRPPIANRFRMQ